MMNKNCVVYYNPRDSKKDRLFRAFREMTAQQTGSDRPLPTTPVEVKKKGKRGAKEASAAAVQRAGNEVTTHAEKQPKLN